MSATTWPGFAIGLNDNAVDAKLTARNYPNPFNPVTTITL